MPARIDRIGGAFVWKGKSWCWTRHHQLGNAQEAALLAIVSHRLQLYHAMHLRNYDSVACVALEDCSGLRSATFLHYFVSSFRDFTGSYFFWFRHGIFCPQDVHLCVKGE